MYKKIFGIFVLTLLITTVIQVIGTNLNEVDVPVWEIGDSWTYKGSFYFASEDGAMNAIAYSDYIFTVIDDSGEFYILEVTTDSTDMNVNMMGVDFTSTKKFTCYAEMKMRKSDLGIEYHNYYIDGIFLPTFGMIKLPIPVKFSSILESEFQPAYLITPFPLYDEKTGEIHESIIFQDGKMSLWGFITLMDDSSSFPTGKFHYNCKEEQITVEAGTFDVYNISFEAGGDYYFTNYAPEVGNSVKQKTLITFGDTDIVYINYQLELKSTNF